MNIFNSLGSNYDLKFALKALFANNKKSYKEKLIKFLEKKYDGRAILVYKGREAIGLALEILNLPKGSDVAINGFTCYAVYKAVIEAGYEAVCLDLKHKFPNRHSGDSERSPVPDGTGRSVEDSRIPQSDRRFWTRRVPDGNPSSQNDVDTTENDFDLNFSAQELLKAIEQNPKIKVVIIQNTLGLPCDIEKIAKICKENNTILIEDLAHSVGTVYKNAKEAGTVGDFVVLSFSQDKIIDAVSGGALIIRNKKYHYFYSSSDQAKPESREVSNLTMKQFNNDSSRQARTISLKIDPNLSPKRQLIDRLYPLFTFIIRKTYPIGVGKLIHSILKAFNLLSKPMEEGLYTKYGLPSWYCSLALYAFDNLEKNLEHRKRIVDIYNSMFNKKITYPSILRYCIFVENRNSLIKFLKDRGVYISDVWYDDVDKSLPNAQITANTILNLPTHKNVSENDARKIAQEVNLWLKSQ